MTRARRCIHGEPRAIDGTACRVCEDDRQRCTICAERLPQALVDLGLRTHAMCAPEDGPDDNDPRSVPWWAR
jgi:hypothetical protein